MTETTQEAVVQTTNTINPKLVAAAKRQRNRRIRTGIITLLVVALLATGGYFLFQFLNKTEEVESQIQSGFAEFSSISSKVEGNGNARAKASAALTLTQGGTVQDVYVTAGDVVMEGQPLYAIYSQAAHDVVDGAQIKVKSAQEALAAAYEDLSAIQKEINELDAKRADLVLRAPFDGKLVSVTPPVLGGRVSEGTSVATIVDDTTLMLSLYFSYAHEGDIKVGQAATVSLPSVMGSFPGTVETIYPVHYISPEGADHFQVDIVFANPGTLTEGIAASATLVAPDGSPVYPYEIGELSFHDRRELLTQAGGPLLSHDLLAYAKVTEGQALLTMDDDDLVAEIASKQEQYNVANEAVTAAQDGVTEAEQALVDAQNALLDFNAVSPINGTVTTCTLAEGGSVNSGDTVLIISNNTTMMVDITVDDRNISFVKPGMMVELSDWNGNTFMGTVTSINTGDAQAGSGMTEFPVTLTVDNYDGSLMEGVWLNYSFVASQSDNCVVVPSQSVKEVQSTEGEIVQVVFVKSETVPENVVETELPEPEPGQPPMYPTTDEGYYPIPVAIGLSDNYNVEITEGLMGGEEIFMNYFVDQAYGW